MKVPMKWLNDFVKIDIKTEVFAELMTMSGSKVESIERLGEEISRVVVGKVISVEKHPDADKLFVVKVDVGCLKNVSNECFENMKCESDKFNVNLDSSSNGIIQVVTGAGNVHAGDYVPVALHGSTLAGGLKIKKGKFRGIESNGMLCSIQELGLTKNDYPNADEDGIFILKSEYNKDNTEYENGKDSIEKENILKKLDKELFAGIKPGQDIKDVLGLDDTIIDFEITPNRPDCLSILGIAREASAVLKTKLMKPEVVLKEEEEDASLYAKVEIEAPDLCLRYAARIIKDIKIEPSPEWMKRRLRAAGVRPINNIVDVTNYVMLEMGQPMHAFDLEFLKGQKIIVRRAKNDEVIRTLDGQERKLDPSMLVIADNERPIAIAGIMGGENSGINEGTKVMLLESANFNGISVRLTSKKLGMRTEASSRFEKNLDVENVITAINRAAQLIEEIGAGKVCKGVIDCFPGEKKDRFIKLRPDRINALLGTSISTETMISILESLEFSVDSNAMLVKIPTFRQDVEKEADIAEEVARIFGYNNIKPTLLEGKAHTVGKKTYKQKLEDMIKYIMMSCGLSEIYTYSLTSPKLFDRMKLPQESPLRNAIVISNPLGEDYSIMRTTTIPSMLGIISRNYNRGVKTAKLFELAFVYLPYELPLKDLPNEKPVLTIGMYEDVDFYDIKGVVEELLIKLRISNYEFVQEKDDPVFHPGRTANLLINGKTAGILGEIHPDIVEEFETPSRTYIGMIDETCLLKNAKLTVEYKPLPKYPAVERDIAIIVGEKITAAEIEKTIKKASGKILEEINLFDTYKGKQIQEGMKSMAYSLTFRAEDRTLTDKEVNDIIAKILNSLKIAFDAKLRE